MKKTSLVHSHQFGRIARRIDALSAKVPHLSALVAGQELPAPPPSVDYTAGMPASFGMMLNDNLGDCTCAAYYHARQIWSFNAGPAEITEPDADVQELYVQACGYNPQAGGPGPGGNEQSVLTYLLNTGAPIGPNGSGREQIVAFVEVDVRNIDDVKRTINDCGVAYIGFNVPANVSYQNRTWDYVPGTALTGDGHAVVLAGYDANGATVISWGQTYTMTWSFFSEYVDETYAIADQSWITAKGSTPAGMSLSQLQSIMQALRSS